MYVSFPLSFPSSGMRFSCVFGAKCTLAFHVAPNLSPLVTPFFLNLSYE